MTSTTSSSTSVLHGIDREWAADLRKQRDALEADAERLEDDYKEYVTQAVTKRNWNKRRDVETDFIHLIQRIIHWKNEASIMTQNDTSVEPDEMMGRIKWFGETFRETLTEVKFIAVDDNPQAPAGAAEGARRQAMLLKLYPEMKAAADDDDTEDDDADDNDADDDDADDDTDDDDKEDVFHGMDSVVDDDDPDELKRKPEKKESMKRAAEGTAAGRKE